MNENYVRQNDNTDADDDITHKSATQLKASMTQLEIDNQALFEDYKDKEFSMDDILRQLGGSSGWFQLMTTIVLVNVFAVGSQVFYSNPFYLQYPAL